MTPLILSGVAGAIVGAAVATFVMARKLRKVAAWGRGYQQRALKAEQERSDQERTVYEFVGEPGSIFQMSDADLAKKWGCKRFQ